jgi:fucose 4-O-acetylase-like acetyltransferase
MGADEVVIHPPRVRDTHADAVRGAAIAALVLSHALTIATQTPQVVGLNDLIISWNMPLFFFVAGWVLALQPPRTTLETVKRRSLTLLLPYVSWIAVLWVIGYPWSGGAGGAGTWFQILFAPKEMWFLYCLFLANVVFTGVHAIGRTPFVVLAGVIVLALAATVVSKWLQPGLLTLSDLGWLLPFLAVGYYGCRISQRQPRWSTPVKFVVAAAMLVLLFATVGTTVFHMSLLRIWPLSVANGVAAELLNHAARYVLAGAGIATVWQLIRLAPTRAVQVLKRLGTATLGIYALNSPTATILRLWFPTWSVAAGPAFTVVIVLLVAAVVLALEWLITVPLARFDFTRRVFLGQWTFRPTASRV